mmetsp:Transcript_25936/g.59934  ORF Transcript_25936/g.59934 Transcript_25936/m.59934 type:complete len:408 (-) Transcript_25936:167-1390(-)|eukprot:2072793-Amphidinium_carterae.1
MALQAQMPNETSGSEWHAGFLKSARARDGRAVYNCLKATEQRPAPKDLPRSTGSGDPVERLAFNVITAWMKKGTAIAFEAALVALRHWYAEYGDASDAGFDWMIYPLMWLGLQARLVAAESDGADARKRTSDSAGKRNLTQLVEVHREQFQKLHRHPEKRAGLLYICSELLQLYFRVQQVGQCGYLLAAVQKGHRQEHLGSLPKALAVTLCYYWGKYSVISDKVKEANEKLSWALKHCSPAHASQCRHILLYLIPCRLRLGNPPSPALLARHNLHTMYGGLTKAVQTGNVRLFNSEFAKRQGAFMSMGLFAMVEKLKLLVHRNLCKAIYRAVAAEALAIGQKPHQQDLAMYEHAFAWQDDCDEDETVCILANLIHLGGLRGYLSDSHKRIVFAKESPFPSPGTWNAG